MSTNCSSGSASTESDNTSSGDPVVRPGPRQDDCSHHVQFTYSADIKKRFRDEFADVYLLMQRELHAVIAVRNYGLTFAVGTNRILLEDGAMIRQFLFWQAKAFPGQVARVWLPIDLGQRMVVFLNSVCDAD